jgi:hypothetical protein
LVSVSTIGADIDQPPHSPPELLELLELHEDEDEEDQEVVVDDEDEVHVVSLAFPVALEVAFTAARAVAFVRAEALLVPLEVKPTESVCFDFNVSASIWPRRARTRRLNFIVKCD